MISAKRKMFVTNQIETNGIKTTVAKPSIVGYIVDLFRRHVLGLPC